MNWDIETAKACKIPDVMPEFCEQCRDIRYCEKYKLNMHQITISELEQTNDGKTTNFLY